METREAERKYPHLLNFLDDSKYLDEATRFSVDLIISDYRSLSEKTQRISNELVMCDCESIVRYLQDFLSKAKEQMQSFEEQLITIERMRVELAEFFCEDHETFKLEECFRIFANFKAKVIQSMEENKKLKGGFSFTLSHQRTDRKDSGMSLTKISDLRATNCVDGKENRAVINGWEYTPKRQSTNKLLSTGSLINVSDGMGCERERPSVVLNTKVSSPPLEEASVNIQRLLRSNKLQQKKVQRLAGTTPPYTTAETLDEFLDQLNSNEKTVSRKSSKRQQEVSPSSSPFANGNVKWTNNGQSIRDSGIEDVDVRSPEADQEQNSINAALGAWINKRKSIRDSGIDDMDVSVNSKHLSMESDMSNDFDGTKEDSLITASDRSSSTDTDRSNLDAQENYSEKSGRSTGKSPQSPPGDTMSTSSPKAGYKSQKEAKEAIHEKSPPPKVGVPKKLRSSKLETASQLLKRVTSIHSNQSYSPAEKERQLNNRKSSLNGNTCRSSKSGESSSLIHVSRANVPITNSSRISASVSNVRSKSTINRIAIRTTLRSSDSALGVPVKGEKEKTKLLKSNDSSPRHRQTVGPKHTVATASVGHKSVTPPEQRPQSMSSPLLRKTYSIKKDRAESLLPCDNKRHVVSQHALLAVMLKAQVLD
ncbi:unnamed protein product [Soboliphyme baturini]|uniref:FH2 domain-containing protein n=1 Tax=Soboliphyme baturini TaxID=241478 RepID=A0A183IXL2_9BILA|nr:unnamed protein product [Soboliphyme baturini]